MITTEQYFAKEKLLQYANETPVFIYSAKLLQSKADQLIDTKLEHHLTVRYAVKANNHPKIVKLFDQSGLHFDAGSSYEVQELIEFGVQPSKISLSSQQPAHNLPELLKNGVQYIATSLRQLQDFVDITDRPDAVGIRINPGIGSGHNNRATTGGVNSGFGLWHEYLPQALEMATQNNFKITRLHIHIGSGADPSKWQETIRVALDIAEKMADVVDLDIGGGYKIHRYGDEQEADMQEILRVFDQELKDFTKRTGRKLNLEIEPGTWLVAHGGVLLAEVSDIVDTGKSGYSFIRLNTGMNDIIRSSMYGARHRLEVLNNVDQTKDYVVIGHNCESGDILTPIPGDPEGIDTIRLNKAKIGDILAIYDVGAYCRSMSAKGYNSFPNAKEIFLDN